MEQYSKTLYIIGGASTALEIRETIELFSNDYDCVVNVVADGSSCRYSFIEDKDLQSHIKRTKIKYYIIGFTDQKLRAKYRKVMDEYNAIPANIIHPTALISKSARIGLGNYIAAYAIISSEVSLGNNNIVNLATTLGHNSVVGDDNVFNPGVRISGCVKIDNRCLIGANAFVYQGVNICSDCMVDAQTYLNQDLKEPSICTCNIGFKKYKNRFV